MKSLYVIGTGGSGKTALCLALALKLAEEGQRVAYFKPVGNVGGVVSRPDEDAVLMKDLLKMKAPVNRIVPFTTSPTYLTHYDRAQDALDTVQDAFREVTEGAEIAVIEGTTSPEMMSGIGLDAVTIARTLGAAAVTVSKVEDDYGLDRALVTNAFIKLRGVHLLGTIFNNVPSQLMPKTQGIARPIMEEHGFPVLGVIPARSELTSPTVQEIWDILGGELLVGEGRLDLAVEDIVVGAMTQDSALNYFRRAFHKAVITGGDRADIALAALETNTSVLILTGGLYPDVKVLAKADEKAVPVLLVPQDTYTAVERLQHVVRKLKASDTISIGLARENLERYCDLESIRQAWVQV